MSDVHQHEEEAGTVIQTEGEPEAEVNEEVVVAPEKSEEDKHIEEQARRMGWRPKEEYNRDPARWVDAKTFVERGERELPVLRDRYRKIDERLANTEQELSASKKLLVESNEAVKQLREMSLKAEERAYARAVQELEEKKINAFRNQDEAAFIEAERRQRELQPPPKPAETPPQQGQPQQQGAPNPIVGRWIAENSWYERDPVLNSYAREQDMEVEREFSYWPLEDKLAEVKRRTVEKFPEKFGNSRRTAATPVATPSAPPPVRQKTGGKTVKDLPADARQALDKLKKQIPGYTDEEYLKVYQWD